MAKQKVTISGLDELLHFMGTIEREDASWEDVDLETLSVVVPVVVKGDTWNGKLDVRGAVFIQDLQKCASVEYAEAVGKRLPRRSLVKAKPSQGSNWLDIDYTEIVKTAITTMPSEYMFPFLGLAILCVTGVVVYRRHADSTDNASRMDVINNAIDSMRKVSELALSQGKEPTRPIRRYMASLRKNDKISVAGSDFMTKKEALSKIARPARDDLLRFTHCDGVYTLLSIDLRDKLPVLYIAQNGTTGKAMFFNRVPESVKEELTKAVDESLEKGIPAEMPLHVDGYFTAKGIRYCVILGIGTPRADMSHYVLADLPHAVISKDALIPGLSS